jgi:hypothetical protein
VKAVLVIAYNDAWVMNAWAKVNKVERDDIVSQDPNVSDQLLMDGSRVAVPCGYKDSVREELRLHGQSGEECSFCGHCG